MMNIIALIIPYFGEFPEWMPLYLYSCSRQKNIDFIFYTDSDIPDKIYRNTIFHRISYQAYCKFVSQRLGVSFSPHNAYKLCDVRPFLGIIHAEELKNYKWWGYGDIDLVYGDLSLLCSDYNLEHYEVLTTHIDKISGHFTIMRNIPKYTLACKLIPKWKELLCSQINQVMDEVYFSNVLIPLKYRIIRMIHWGFLKRITKGSSYFYWLYKLSRLFTFWHTSILMDEYFTTFAPSDQGRCEYDLKTSTIFCSTNQKSKIPKWAAQIYLHFLFFKKTPYLIADHYWKKGFYKIPTDYDFSKGGVVQITNSGIEMVSSKL